MFHNKTKHLEYVSQCEKFKRGECSRSESSCWFKHGKFDNGISYDVKSSQVFHKTHKANAPPDQLSEILNLMTQMSKQMEAMEKDIQNLQKENSKQIERI